MSFSSYTVAHEHSRRIEAEPTHSILPVTDGATTEFFDGPALVLPERQLRITRRCLRDDLGREPDSDLEDLQEIAIVKAFIRERRTKVNGTRQVEPLHSGKPIWVLGHGHRHRGGTWHDEDHDVIWLVAAGHHDSGDDGDFFPYCKDLDARDLLLPTAEDYEALLKQRDAQFAARLMIEAPLLLKRARASGQEEKAQIGGKFGAALALEVADDIEQISVAFDIRPTTVWTYIPAILGAITPGSDWESTDRMPSRGLQSHEIAFTWMGSVA